MILSIEMYMAISIVYKIVTTLFFHNQWQSSSLLLIRFVVLFKEVMQLLPQIVNCDHS